MNIVLKGGPHDGTEMSIEDGLFVLTLETQRANFDTRAQGWAKDDKAVITVKKETYFATGRVLNGKEIYACIR